MRRRNLSTGSMIVLLILAAIYFFFQSNQGLLNDQAGGANPPVNPSGTVDAAPQWGNRTKISECKANGGLPDPACTPGDIFPDATKDEICVPGYTQTVRDVPESLKQDVYDSYGIKTRTPGQYEVDHFVSLELGGSNDISNLWPEPAEPKPGCHEKDKVENYLHNQVCSGAMTLEEAQIKIATNWLDVYNSMPNK
jgi:hypothetical protein